MTDESIRQLESAALEYAKAHNQPHRSLQEHAARCTAASALLIAAAMELSEDEPAD